MSTTKIELPLNKKRKNPTSPQNLSPQEVSSVDSVRDKKSKTEEELIQDTSIVIKSTSSPLATVLPPPPKIRELNNPALIDALLASDFLADDEVRGNKEILVWMLERLNLPKQQFYDWLTCLMENGGLDINMSFTLDDGGDSNPSYSALTYILLVANLDLNASAPSQEDDTSVIMHTTLDNLLVLLDKAGPYTLLLEYPTEFTENNDLTASPLGIMIAQRQYDLITHFLTHVKRVSNSLLQEYDVYLLSKELVLIDAVKQCPSSKAILLELDGEKLSAHFVEAQELIHTEVVYTPFPTELIPEEDSSKPLLVKLENSEFIVNLKEKVSAKTKFSLLNRVLNGLYPNLELTPFELYLSVMPEEYPIGTLLDLGLNINSSEVNPLTLAFVDLIKNFRQGTVQEEFIKRAVECPNIDLSQPFTSIHDDDLPRSFPLGEMTPLMFAALMSQPLKKENKRFVRPAFVNEAGHPVAKKSLQETGTELFNLMLARIEKQAHDFVKQHRDEPNFLQNFEQFFLKHVNSDYPRGTDIEIFLRPEWRKKAIVPPLSAVVAAPLALLKKMHSRILTAATYSHLAPQKLPISIQDTIAEFLAMPAKKETKSAVVSGLSSLTRLSSLSPALSTYSFFDKKIEKGAAGLIYKHSDLPPNFAQFDTLAEGDCLFIAVAMSYLLKEVNKRTDSDGYPDSFALAFQTLFGIQHNEYILPVYQSLLMYDGERTTLSENAVLKNLICTVFRSNVVEYMRQHPTMFAAYIDEDTSLYYTNMLKSGTFGGEPEIQAMHQMLGVPIHVYRLGQRHYIDTTHATVTALTALPSAPIRIVHVPAQSTQKDGRANNHYHFAMDKEQITPAMQEYINKYELHNHENQLSLTISY